MPFSTQGSYFSENDYNVYTARPNYNDDNEYYIHNEYDNENDDFQSQLFPDSTNPTPSVVATFMPIDPSSGEDEGESEVRYNDKVVSYGLSTNHSP